MCPHHIDNQQQGLDVRKQIVSSSPPLPPIQTCFFYSCAKMTKYGRFAFFPTSSKILDKEAYTVLAKKYSASVC